MELPNNRVEALSSVFTALNRYMLHCMVIGKWFLISWIQTCHRKTMVQFEKICKKKPSSWKTALFSRVMPLNFHFFSFRLRIKRVYIHEKVLIRKYLKSRIKHWPAIFLQWQRVLIVIAFWYQFPANTVWEVGGEALRRTR